MFSQACVILFTGGCLPQCMLGYTHVFPPPPRADTPPAADTPAADTPPEQTPPWEQTPPSRHPPCRACCQIRSTHGRYASYWNAILFCFVFSISWGFRELFAKLWGWPPPSPGDGTHLTIYPGSNPEITSRRCTPVGENGVSSEAGSGRPLPSLTDS